jgi:predicted Zn-dependent peptidase/cytochrome c5
MRLALLVTLLHLAAPLVASATPCARKTFATSLVRDACAKGGQEAAKAAMQDWAKSKGIRTCNQCHSVLAPNYPLKADALADFAKRGGQLLAPTPAPTPAPPPTPTPTPRTTMPRRPEPVPIGDPIIKFEKYTLPNGLEVILVPDSGVPVVSVNVWYHVGSGHEVYGRSGFAHLFEHMMFQGSKHVGEDRHFAILKTIGESGVNGTTNLDRTNYFETVPAHQLDTALWLEADRMGYLLQPPAGVDFAKSLANQIEVVRNERRQNYDNAPYGKALFAQFAGLFPERHPYRYLTIGKHEDLVKASVDDVKNFFKTWYVPANATLAVVGDLDVAATKRSIERLFGSFPKSVKPKPVTVPPPLPKASETTVDDEFAKLRQIRFSWISPARFAEGDAELAILADALTREGVGRLYRTLVYDRPLAQSVGAGQGGSSFSGIFSITVTLRREADMAEVKRLVLEEVARVTRETLADKELGRVLAGLEASVIRGLETTMGRAELLQSYNHYLGDPAWLSWDLDRYRKTNTAKIRDAAAKYLVREHTVVTITNPISGAKQ